MTLRIVILVIFAIGMVFTPYIKDESDKLLKKPAQVDNKADNLEKDEVKTA